MRRTLGLVLVFSLALVFLVSCGKNSGGGTTSEPSVSDAPVSETPVSSPDPTSDPTPVPTPTQTPLTSHDIVIEVREYRFNPSTIKVRVGEEITVTLRNKGTDIHDFVVTKISRESHAPYTRPGQESKVTFSFQSPGRYEFMCTVGNHAELGMTGTVIVTSP